MNCQNINKNSGKYLKNLILKYLLYKKKTKELLVYSTF